MNENWRVNGLPSINNRLANLEDEDPQEAARVSTTFNNAKKQLEEHGLQVLKEHPDTWSLSHTPFGDTLSFIGSCYIVVFLHDKEHNDFRTYDYRKIK
jgi:hypothetical protein